MRAWHQWLGRALGNFVLSPVWGRELAGLLRHRGAYAVMAAGALAASALAIVLWPNRVLYRGDAYLGRSLFYFFATLQAVLVTFAGAGMTGCALNGERERGTWELLRATSVGTAGIVFPKMAASLVFLLLFILGALPVLATVFMAGGVSAAEVAAAYVVTAVSGLSGLVIGLLHSALWRRTSQSVVASAVTLLILNLPWVLHALGTRGSSLDWPSPLRVLQQMQWSVRSAEQIWPPVLTLLWRSALGAVLGLVAAAAASELMAEGPRPWRLPRQLQAARGAGWREMPARPSPVFWEDLWFRLGMRGPVGWAVRVAAWAIVWSVAVAAAPFHSSGPRGTWMLVPRLDPEALVTVLMCLICVPGWAAGALVRDRELGRCELLRAAGVSSGTYFCAKLQSVLLPSAILLLTITGLAAALAGLDLAVMIESSERGLAPSQSIADVGCFVLGSWALALGVGLFSSAWSDQTGSAALLAYGLLGLYAAATLSSGGLAAAVAARLAESDPALRDALCLVRSRFFLAAGLGGLLAGAATLLLSYARVARAWQRAA